MSRAGRAAAGLAAATSRISESPDVLRAGAGTETTSLRCRSARWQCRPHVLGRFDPRSWLQASMAAILPIVPMLVWHLVIHGRPAEDASQDVVEDAAQDVPERAATQDLAGSTTARRRPKVPAKVQVERLVRRHGQDVTADMVATRTGVSRRHAVRLLAQVRKPRVVGGGQAEVQ
jgi:hypothetical protein